MNAHTSHIALTNTWVLQKVLSLWRHESGITWYVIMYNLSWSLVTYIGKERRWINSCLLYCKAVYIFHGTFPRQSADYTFLSLELSTFLSKERVYNACIYNVCMCFSIRHDYIQKTHFTQRVPWLHTYVIWLSLKTLPFSLSDLKCRDWMHTWIINTLVVDIYFIPIRLQRIFQ